LEELRDLVYGSGLASQSTSLARFESKDGDVTAHLVAFRR
jgi:hypothetical protein